MTTDELDGATWRKARASDNQGNCVEVANTGRVVGVRDTKDPAGTVLRFAAAEWSAFTDAVRRGGYA